MTSSPNTRAIHHRDDPDQRIARSFGTIGVPETFLLDRDGRLVERWTGQIEPMSTGVIAKVREALARAGSSAASR